MAEACIADQVEGDVQPCCHGVLHCPRNRMVGHSNDGDKVTLTW